MAVWDVVQYLNLLAFDLHRLPLLQVPQCNCHIILWVNFDRVQFNSSSTVSN